MVIAEFTDPALSESLILKLETSKQLPDQRVSAFVAHIDRLYRMAYGEHREDAACDEAKILKNKMMKRIFITGLRKDIQEVFCERYKPDCTYEDVTTAKLAEKMVTTKLVHNLGTQFSKPTTPSSSTTDLSKDIELIKTQLATLLANPQKEQEHKVAAVYYKERSRSKVQFKNGKKSSSSKRYQSYTSRDSSRYSNRSRSRERSNSRSRSASHESYKGSDKKKSNSPYPSKTIICDRCEHPGHIAKDCCTKNKAHFQKSK